MAMPNFDLEEVRTDNFVEPKSAPNSFFSGYIWRWYILCGFISFQIQQFCLFAYPIHPKMSLVTINYFFGKIWVNSNCSRVQLANTWHCLWSFTLSFWVSWIFHGCRHKSWCQIRLWMMRWDIDWLGYFRTLMHSSDVIIRPCVSLTYRCVGWLFIEPIDSILTTKHWIVNLSRMVVVRIKIT